MTASISDAVKARIPLVRELIATGKSRLQIAQALGLTKGQVEGITDRWLRDEWKARPNPRQPVHLPPPAVTLEPPQTAVVPVVVEPDPEPWVPPEPALPAWLTQPIPPPRECQWPMTPWRRPWPFCEGPVVPGCPYCEAHSALAWAGKARRVAA